jgi:hypothetical protein
MDIDLNWCVCGCQTAKDSLYCSPDCQFREMGVLPPTKLVGDSSSCLKSCNLDQSILGRRKSSSSFESDDTTSTISVSPPCSISAPTNWPNWHDRLHSRPALDLMADSKSSNVGIRPMILGKNQNTHMK